MLQAASNDSPAFCQDDAIIICAALGMDASEQERRAAVDGRIDQPLGCLHRLPDEFRLQHQVFGRIAGQLQFRHQDQVGALGGGLGAPLQHLLGIAGQVANPLAQLDKCDAKAIGHR